MTKRNDNPYEEGLPARIHVYPVDSRGRTTHRTNNTEVCWCNLEERQVCPEANARGVCKQTCFRCGGSGDVPYYDETIPVMLVHSPGQIDDALKELTTERRPDDSRPK